MWLTLIISTREAETESVVCLRAAFYYSEFQTRLGYRNPQASNKQPGLVEHICNPNICEAEAREPLHAIGRLVLHSKCKPNNKPL